MGRICAKNALVSLVIMLIVPINTNGKKVKKMKKGSIILWEIFNYSV